MYIEVELTLNSFDILQLRTLTKKRIKELEDLKAANTAWFFSNMADEQIDNHKVTLRKLDEAHKRIREIKRESDEAYRESLNTKRA